VSDALFAPAVPAGPLRQALDSLVTELTGSGTDLPADLVLVAQSLADRIDDANRSRVSRGFGILTAEFRAARRDLFAGTGVTPDDSFAAALAEFRAAEAGHPAGPVPDH
jgi:hypothetical protein